MKDDKDWLINQLLDYKERLETLELKMNHLNARVDTMKTMNKMLYRMLAGEDAESVVEEFLKKDKEK